MNLILNPLMKTKKVSSLDQFSLCMNKEDLFDSFPGIGNVIVSDAVCAVSHLHNKDIVYRGYKPSKTFSVQFSL